MALYYTTVMKPGVNHLSFGEWVVYKIGGLFKRKEWNYTDQLQRPIMWAGNRKKTR